MAKKGKTQVAKVEEDAPVEKKWQVVYKRLQELVPTEGNPRRHKVSTIRQSIKHFGYVSPVIITGNTIVAGHGRVEAAAMTAGQLFNP